MFCLRDLFSLIILWLGICTQPQQLTSHLSGQSCLMGIELLLAYNLVRVILNIEVLKC